MITKISKKQWLKTLFAIHCSLFISVALTSCADYNETDNFSAEPDPSFVEPFKDLAPVKTYINREQYPNMSLGATLNVTDFNKQELAHAAAITNFDNVTFGTSLMSGKIVNEKGVMNFLDMMDLLDHVEEINADVYGSPIFANANQADGWLKTLTAPIEIPVDYVEGKVANYNDSTSFSGTIDNQKGKASIVKFDDQNVLEVGVTSDVRIIEGFEVDSKAKYTATFWAKAQAGKEVSYTITFSGNPIAGTATADGKWKVKSDKWYKIVVEAQSAEGVTDGYLRIENGKNGKIYIQKVQVGYYPDNHRPQTAQEINDTINYAVSAWCDGLMKINEGRIKTFDLIDEAIDTKATLDNGMYDIKHSTDQIYWQDILGSENYAPIVSREASKAFEEHGGNLTDLKFFISESGLNEDKKLESLKYWIGIWDNHGAKIDGINAKLNLSYSENPTTQAANEEAVKALLDKLAATGKMIRLSNFDIKYLNEAGSSVSADKITSDQRQKLADYYGFVIKQYMQRIPNDKQAGLCKTNMVDTGDPVGLWTKNSKQEWVRTVTYKAFCDALSGQ